MREPGSAASGSGCNLEALSCARVQGPSNSHRGTVRYVFQVKRKRKAIREARQLILYATTDPKEQLPLTKVIPVYQGAPRINRNFQRMKGHLLGLRPLYVQRDDHVRGMVHLLSLAFRVLTLVEHVVRE